MPADVTRVEEAIDCAPSLAISEGLRALVAEREATGALDRADAVEQAMRLQRALRG